MATQITSLTDPRMRARSAYGTRAGSLREHLATEDREGDTERSYRELCDACTDEDEAQRLIGLGRAVMRATCSDGRLYNSHDALAALDRVLDGV